MSEDLQVSQNPYDPETLDLQTQTMPLDQVVEVGLRKLALGLNVWRPAKITKKLGNGRVNVEILLQAKYINKPAPFTLPEIQDALVCFPRGADYSIKVPLKEGDTGIALFCDRSLANWSVQGGTVFPNDTRMHHISDVVFIPGLYPFSDQVMDDTTDLVLTNGDAQIKLQAGGTFLIKNKQQELLDLMDQFIGLVKSLGSTTSTFVSDVSSGPVGQITSPVPGSPVVTSPILIAALLSVTLDLTMLDTQLSTLKTNLETLKGS